MPERMSAAQAAGTALTVRIGDRDLRLRALTMDDLAEFEAHLRSQRLADFFEHIGQYHPDAQVSLTLKLSRGVFSTDDLFDQMGSPGGAQWMFRRVLAESNPGVELNGLGIKVPELLNLMERLLIFSELLDPKELAKAKEAIRQKRITESRRSTGEASPPT